MITSKKLVELGVAKYVNPDDARADLPKLTRAEFDGYGTSRKAAAMKDVSAGKLQFVDD